MAIAGAFVAGTILASTMYDNTAFAIHQPKHNPPGDDDDMGWKAAVAGLQDQIDNLETQVGNDNDTDPTNELQTPTTATSTTAFMGLDLDDPADVDFFECGPTGFFSKISIGSCPDGGSCAPGDDLAWSVKCTNLSLSP